MSSNQEHSKVKSEFGRLIFRHVMITVLAVAIMGLLTIITLMAKPLNPIKRAISEFSFTDIYYEIEGEGGNEDTCRFITLVDMTRVTSRTEIAKVLEDIESCNPKVIGLDCVFDNVGEDIDGNVSLINVAEKYKNIVYSEKFLDFKNDSLGHTTVIHSFFADEVKIKEGPTNMSRQLYDGIKRKALLTWKYDGKDYPAFFVRIANEYAGKDLAKGKDQVLNINFSPTCFQVLLPSEVKKHPELIEDRIVMFGSLYEDSDMHWSPLGKIAGVELLAYSLQTLINSKEVKSVPFVPFCIISLLMVFVVQLLQTVYLKYTNQSSNMFVKYVIGSTYVLNILTFLFTSVFIGLSFVVFNFFSISFNVVWAISVIAFLGTSRSMFSSICDYVNSIKDKNRFLRNIRL